jgi:hypothetical protein
VNLFLSLSHKRKGYGKANVTPYMHITAYHVGFFLEKYGNIKQFSGQGKLQNTRTYTLGIEISLFLTLYCTFSCRKKQ